MLPDMAVFYMFTAATAGAISQGCGLKIGLTVPQSLGGAVQRNRIKRRMREALRLSLPALAGEVAADVVLHPRRSVATLPFPELLQEVKQALESVQARKGSARAPGAQRMKAKP